MLSGHLQIRKALGQSARPQMRAQFQAADQVQNTNSEAAEQAVRKLGLQRAGTLEHIMELRLRNLEHPRQAALGKLSISNFGHDKGDEPALQIMKSQA